MIKEITELLINNPNALNRDKYIQLDKSVHNTDISAPYQWIDGLQLNEKTNKVTLWLSTENSESIKPIAIECIDRMTELLNLIKEELERTIYLSNKETKPTFKDEMLFTDRSIFGDDEEHEYEIECQDGFATAVPTIYELENNPKAPKRLEFTYPKLNELGYIGKRKCLDYRGLYAEPVSSCSYADVCMSYGKIKKPSQSNV